MGAKFWWGWSVRAAGRGCGWAARLAILSCSCCLSPCESQPLVYVTCMRVVSRRDAWWRRPGDLGKWRAKKVLPSLGPKGQPTREPPERPLLLLIGIWDQDLDGGRLFPISLHIGGGVGVLLVTPFPPSHPSPLPSLKRPAWLWIWPGWTLRRVIMGGDLYKAEGPSRRPGLSIMRSEWAYCALARRAGYLFGPSDPRVWRPRPQRRAARLRERPFTPRVVDVDPPSLPPTRPPAPGNYTRPAPGLTGRATHKELWAAQGQNITHLGRAGFGVFNMNIEGYGWVNGPVLRRWLPRDARSVTSDATWKVNSGHP